jgi:hypothetical protein
VKAVYGKTVCTVWAADGGQRYWRASSDPTGHVVGKANEAPPQTDEMYIGWMSDIR